MFIYVQYMGNNGLQQEVAIFTIIRMNRLQIDSYLLSPFAKVFQRKSEVPTHPIQEEFSVTLDPVPGWE